MAKPEKINTIDSMWARWVTLRAGISSPFRRCPWTAPPHDHIEHRTPSGNVDRVTMRIRVVSPPPSIHRLGHCRDALRLRHRGRMTIGSSIFGSVATTVVFAEDSFIVREGVRMLLEEAGYDVIAIAEDYDELMAAVERTPPDVVVTDIRMPPTRTDEGVQAARQIHEEHPDIGVVVLSQYVEPDYALRLLEGGSAGFAYLLKERVGDVGQLVAAITAVQEGGSVVDPKVVDALVEARLNRKESKIDRLTPREREVMEELASGKSNSAIAGALFLSERAVEKHINSIFTKLDLLPERESNRRVRAVLLYLAETAT